MSESLRGSLLIATRNLRDPNFFRSVVLVVGHGDEGSMGFVINRPSDLTVTEALKKHFDLPDTGDLVYAGGPVERNALFVLHNAAEYDGGEMAVVDGLYVGNSQETFETIVRRSTADDPELKFRVFFGYAGWDGGQLESELNRNDWHVLPASAEHVFAPEPYKLWDEALAAYRQANPLVPGSEGSPDLN